MGIFVVLVKFVPTLIAAIVAVERLISAHGKEKQDAASDLISVLGPILGSTVTEQELRVPAIQEAVRAGIDSLIKIENVVKAFRATQQPPTTP